ncbi:MAG: DUF1273 family protein [Oscillospiraceae bacterium]|nr:DUF1273 family protein [Oscillospiraceae bacterium]
MNCAIISNIQLYSGVRIDRLEKTHPELRDLLHTELEALITEGCTCFYTNGEYGVPLLCAELLSQMQPHRNITLHMVFPFEEQANDWSERVREIFFTLHCHAEDSEIHFTHYRPDCYALTDRYLIECSDMVFIPSLPGSCQDAERYACSLRKRIRRLTIDLRP